MGVGIPTNDSQARTLHKPNCFCHAALMSISVFLADDNLLVREGVRALIEFAGDFEVVGVAEDFDGLVDGATETNPQVVVTDIRMPPSFSREGIEAAALVRKRHPGTGIVVLSQYDDPEYAIALLSEGAAGYAYLLKDRVADGDQLVRAIREVASGGSMLDPSIVAALTRPVHRDGDLTADEESLLQAVASGTPMKAIARRSERRRQTSTAASNGCSWPSPNRCNPGTTPRSSVSRCCTGPSSNVKSRGRLWRGCCPVGSRKSCAVREAHRAH